MCQEYEKMWHALSKDWFCPATRQFVERMASSEQSPRGFQNISTSLDFVTGANLAQYTAFFDHWSSRPRNWDVFASAKEVELCRTCNSRARVQSQSKSDLTLTWYSGVHYDYDGYKNISINHKIYMNPPKLELCLKDRYINIILQKLNCWEVERRPVAKRLHVGIPNLDLESQTAQARISWAPWTRRLKRPWVHQKRHTGLCGSLVGSISNMRIYMDL